MGAILLRDISVDDVRKDILIQDGLIRRIEPAGSGSSWDLAGDIEIMDCSGKVAVPGFVNMHTHSPMSLMRGIGEDMIFQDWLARIWKVEDRLDKEYVYWATKVACLEMIRTGTTTFNDQYWFFDTSVQAAREMGVRIATGYDVMDKGSSMERERQKEQCMAKSAQYLGEKGGNGLIYNLAFHAIYSVSEEMMLWTAEFAREHDLNLHIHLCETRKEVEDCKAAHGGLTPVEYLDRLGILSPRLLAAHTLWVTPHDIELLAAHGVNCIHNVNSNTKLASGYRFLYNEMRDAGINVCIGTDGCAVHRHRRMRFVEQPRHARGHEDLGNIPEGLEGRPLGASSRRAACHGHGQRCPRPALRRRQDSRRRGGRHQHSRHRQQLLPIPRTFPRQSGIFSPFGLHRLGDMQRKVPDAPQGATRKKY